MDWSQQQQHQHHPHIHYGHPNGPSPNPPGPAFSDQAHINYNLWGYHRPPQNDFFQPTGPGPCTYENTYTNHHRHHHRKESGNNHEESKAQEVQVVQPRTNKDATATELKTSPSPVSVPLSVSTSAEVESEPARKRGRPKKQDQELPVAATGATATGGQSSGDSDLTCSICSSTFSSVGNLKRHALTTHTDNKQPYPCDLCDKRYTQPGSLATHKLRIHQGLRVYHQCHRCNLKFDKKYLLDNHLQTHRDDNEEGVDPNEIFMELENKKSGRVTLDKSEVDVLKKQDPTGFVRLSFECTICPKSFTEAGGLKRHMLSHSTEPTLQCPHCPKMFRQRYLRLKHIRLIHPSEPKPKRAKPSSFRGQFECSACQRCFCTEVNRARHKCDKDEGKLQCPYCHRRFRVQKFLECHLNNHLNNGRLKSKYCDRRFALRQALTLHEKWHVEKGVCLDARKKYLGKVCTICQEASMTSTLFQKHFMAKHNRKCSFPVARFEVHPIAFNSEDSTTQLNREASSFVLCPTCGNCFKRSDFKFHVSLSDKCTGTELCLPSEERAGIRELAVMAVMGGLPSLIGQDQTGNGNDGMFNADSNKEDDDAGVESTEGNYEPGSHEDDDDDEDMDEKPDLEILQALKVELEEPEDDEGLEFQLNTPEGLDTEHADAEMPEPQLQATAQLAQAVSEFCVASCKLCKARIPADCLKEHIQNEHNTPVRVAVNKMVFKFMSGRYQTLSVVRPSDESFDIPWFMCSKCGSSSPYRHIARQHKEFTCPRKRDYLARRPKFAPSRDVEHESNVRKYADVVDPIAFNIHDSTFGEDWQENWTDNVFSYSDLDPRAKVLANSKSQCTICDRVFPSKRTLEHMATHGEKQWTCDECGVRLSSKYTLTAHKRLHTGEKPYACRMCDKRYPCPTSRFIHERDGHKKKSNQEDGQFLCRICNSSFQSYAVLRHHMAAHHPNERFSKAIDGPRRPPRIYCCDQCPNTYGSSKQLQHHMKFVHPVDGIVPDRPSFNCGQCERVLKDRSSLRRHLIIFHPKDGNTNRKFFACKLCDREFSLIITMRQHLRSQHGGIIPRELATENIVTILSGNVFNLEDYYVRRKLM